MTDGTSVLEALTGETTPPLKVLLVQDNREDAQLITDLLHTAAPDRVLLTHAGGLEHARGELVAGEFDAIVLDLSLPNSEGLATFAAAQAMAHDAPIVVLAGRWDEDLAASAVRSGAQDYLVKGQTDGRLLYQAIRFAIERRRIERTLRASETSYRGLVEGSIQAIAILVDGIIRLANPALARLLGLATSDECLGRSIWSVIAPDHREMVAGYFESQSAELAEPNRFECRVIRADGAVAWVDGIATSVTWHDERAIMATVVDISKRKRAEEALRRSEEHLRQAQRMEVVGRLAGGVAHDFNNFLTVITSYADLLIREIGGPRDVTIADLQEIQNAASTAAALARQLLAFTRQQVLQPIVLSLNEVVSSTENLLQRLIGEEIAVSLVLDARMPRVRADVGQLEQILTNLAVNSRDAMPNGGDFTIETSIGDVDNDDERAILHLTGGYAILSVSDSGAGMSAETQARMFEPFFTTKESNKGSGLGLATVYGIVEQCGGVIRVESALARGTKFRIYLPLVTEHGQLPGTEPPTSASVGTKTLLLVEDAARVRLVMRRALEDFGYRVVEAPNEKTALTLAARHPSRIDLLISEAEPAEASGLGLATRLRDANPALRAVFISDQSDDVMRQRVDAPPWASYLQRPFMTEDLARTVREVLDQGDPT